MSAAEDITEKFEDSRYFTFRTADPGANSQLENSVFALRYQVYCIERGFLSADDYPNGLEQDEYDEFSTHVAAINQGGLVVGSLRIVYPSKLSFPFRHHCDRLFPGRRKPDDSECIEISRLVISKVYRRRADDTPLGFSEKLAELNPDGKPVYSLFQQTAERRKIYPEILMGLIKQMYQQCKRSGVGYWYVAMEPSLARMLKRIHFLFEPIGEQQDYYGMVTPYILSIADFEANLRVEGPALYKWLQTEAQNPVDAATE